MTTHNQRKRKLKKIETYGSKEEIKAYKEWLMSQLKREETMEYNAEESLRFIMNKFKFLFDIKKKLIAEIEKRNNEIIKLKNILKI